MKDMNKLLYDILLKIELNNGHQNKPGLFKINQKLINKYFKDLNDEKSDSYLKFETYFREFYNFCFDIPLNNMVRDLLKFRN